MLALRITYVFFCRGETDSNNVLNNLLWLTMSLKQIWDDNFAEKCSMPRDNHIHTYIAFFITYKRYTDFYLMNRNCLAKLLGDSYPFDDEMKENLIHQVIQSDFFGMVKT